jgi:hypothetical protein
LTRRKQRDGGVYLDPEVVALSRDIPASLRWLVSRIVLPIVLSTLAVTACAQEEVLVIRVACRPDDKITDRS